MKSSKLGAPIFLCNQHKVYQIPNFKESKSEILVVDFFLFLNQNTDCLRVLLYYLSRKKKLTSHWKRFIRPLSWRCKWIELKLKQLQSQALEYEKELAAYDCRKQQEFANFTLDVDGFSAKSVPLSGQICRRKVVNRKKRKRVEDTCDLASYMSNHSAFSYYGMVFLE